MLPPPDLIAAAGYGARRLSQAYLAAWNRHVDPVLTGPQYAVLCAIRAYPDADPTSLASAVALDTSTMADVCRRMERKGLILRDAAPHDARAKVLRVTEEGAAAYTEVTRRTRAPNGALLAHCPEEQRSGIAAMLNTLGEQWESVAESADL